MAAVTALSVGLFAAVTGPSSADVTSVTGSAFGYEASVSLFGGPPNTAGPSPTVTLAADAADSPQTATEPTARVAFGPAFFLTSDTIEVSTSGTLGATGSVTSTASLQNLNKATTQPEATGSELFTADSLSSTCTADESGVTGSTTVVNATLRVDAQPTDHDEVEEAVPANPEPNTVMAGHLHVDPNVDRFVFVFNEQTTNPDGSITVTALHQYIGYIVNDQGQIVEDPVTTDQNGSIARGHVYLGQVVCGVTGTGTGTTTTLPDGVTTTTQPGATTTTQPGATTTTTQPGATTTTTRPATTTTTRPSATTTTTTMAPSGKDQAPPPNGGKSSLVRTGSSFQSLVVFGTLTLVLGALVLVGFGHRAAGAVAGGGSAPWAAFVRQVVLRHRRQRPWNRRRWM